jgi:hypothetical protein
VPGVHGLDEWLVDDRRAAGCARYTASMMSKEFQLVVNTFTPYFEDFKPFMDDLRIAIFTKHTLSTFPLSSLPSTGFMTRGDNTSTTLMGNEHVSHETVLCILQAALESVSEPPETPKRKRKASTTSLAGLSTRRLRTRDVPVAGPSSRHHQLSTS